MKATRLDIEAMRDAAERFAAAKAAGDASGQRTAIADSLSAMMDAVGAATREAGIAPGTLAPLVELLAALADANASTRHPLLEKAKKNGRGRLEINVAYLYGYLSAGITVLMRDGEMSEPDAIRHVQRRLRTAGVPLPAKLDGMRDKVMTGEKGDGVAATAYSDALDYLTSVETMTAAAKVDRLLDILAAKHGQPKTS